jgi:hypothetical protein
MVCHKKKIRGILPSNLRCFLRFWFLAVFFLTMPIVQAYSETYPEFTGDYIDCGGKWCEIKGYWMEVMTLLDRTTVSITYRGFFHLPNAINVKSKKPRILMYSGRESADPRTVALVELGKLPYNDVEIYQINKDKYEGKITYSKNSGTKQLWTYKREIPLRFKPIEGKTGMGIFEPVEPLTDGFYAIDSRHPAGTGPQSLKTGPQTVQTDGLYSLVNREGVLTFFVGDVDNINNLTDTENPKKTISTNTGSDENYTNKSERNNDSQVNQPSNDIEKAVDGFLKGIFGQ